MPTRLEVIDQMMDTISTGDMREQMKQEFGEQAVNDMNFCMVQKLPQKSKDELAHFISGFWLGLRWWKAYGTLDVQPPQSKDYDYGMPQPAVAVTLGEDVLEEASDG